MTAGSERCPQRDRGERVRLQRAARLRVELVERVRGEADEERAREPPGGEQADERDADELEHAGRPAGAEVRRRSRAPGPAKRSSARPIAATGGDARLERADDPADERQAQAAVVRRRAGRTRAGRRGAGGRGARTRAGRVRSRRWRSGSSTSSTVEPGASASSVIRASQPKPAAIGKHARARRGDSARWPESGSRSSRPVAEPEELARGALDDARSRRPAARRTRRRRGRRRSRAAAAGRRARSASQRSRRPGRAARSASVSAWPLPRRGSRRTRAPAASAAAAVASREPSSATITSASGNASRSAATGRADPAPPRRGRRRGSSDGSATGGGRRDRRQDAVVARSSSRRTARARRPPSSSASASRPASVSRSSTVERFCLANASTADVRGLRHLRRRPRARRRTPSPA